MIVLAGGPVRKYRPSLFVVLEETVGQLEDIEAIDFSSDVKESGRASVTTRNHNKNSSKKKKYKTSPNIVYCSYDERPYQSFEQTFKMVPNSRAILFFMPAGLALAEFLEASLSPDEAVFAWKETVTEMLAFIKQNRKSVILFNSQDTLSFPNAFLEFCVNKFRFNGTDSIGELETPKAPSAFYQMLAFELVQQNPDVQKLQNELHAYAIPFGSKSNINTFDVAALTNEYNEMREHLKRSETQLAKLKQRDSRNSDAIRNLKATTSQLEEQNSLNLEHIAEVQSQAETYYLELQNAKDQIKGWENKAAWRKAKALRETKALQEDIDRHAKTIDALKSSASWRLSTPIRLVGRVLKYKNRKRKLSVHEIKMIKQSNLFDAEWYKETYSDVALQKADPFNHYIKFGGFEGRSPGPNFNAREYLQNNSTVAISGENPLVHYLKNSKQSSEQKLTNT